MVSSPENEALTLNLGLTSSTNTLITTHNKNNNNNNQPNLAHVDQEPSLALTLLSGETYHTTTTAEPDKKVLADHPELPCISVSVASSLSHGVVSVKRERESDDLELELDRGGGSSRLISDEDEEDGCVRTNTPRKKLCLTKEQSAFLEDSFKHQSTLNPKQKQALADRLNLGPRQVEVWFQNRRARTKLKQTEVDCEYLKKCCETLTDENKRLQKELQELKAMKLGHSFYMQLPAATLTMCPSCERIGAGVPISGGHKKSHFHPAQHIRPLLVD